MLNLSTHQLNVFLVAAETLNFTQAAQRLQMTQPSVSQHIQALEEHFGSPLFVRSGRSLELTDAGLALVPLARELVNLSLYAEEMMASLKGDIQGHLVVGCSTSFGRYILPRLLACFHRQFSQVRVTCRVTSNLEALQGVEEGRVHLALITASPPTQEVEAFKVAEERIVLIAPAGHPWALRGEVTLSDLAEADFILPDEGTEIYAALSDCMSRAGLPVNRLQSLVTLGSLEAIALSVQEGIGVGFVPEQVVDRLVQNQVVLVPVQGLSIQTDMYACRSARRPASAALSAFWEYICDPQNPVIHPMVGRSLAVH